MALIGSAELLIYLWAVWTTTFDASNFFAIKPEFIFDKCARNAGRISSALMLTILLTACVYILYRVYIENKRSTRATIN